VGLPEIGDGHTEMVETDEIEETSVRTLRVVISGLYGAFALSPISVPSMQMKNPICQLYLNLT
jgi:hypothetical protein